MEKLIYFIPLLGLTVYIVFLSAKNRKESKTYEESQKLRLMKDAQKMLKQGVDYDSIRSLKIRFTDYDFTDQEAPRAEFMIASDKGSHPFEAKEGMLIRYKKVR